MRSAARRAMVGVRWAYRSAVVPRSEWPSTFALRAPGHRRPLCHDSRGPSPQLTIASRPATLAGTLRGGLRPTTVFPSGGREGSFVEKHRSQVSLGTGLILAMAWALVAMPVLAQEDAGAPVGVSGAWSWCDAADYVTAETTEGESARGYPITLHRGGSSWTPVTASDPRLAGTLRGLHSSDVYDVGDEAQIIVMSLITRIENDDGAWSGASNGFYDTAATNDPDPSTDILTLVGSGDYEGLTAIIQLIGVGDKCEYTFRGVIVDGGLPPLPEVGAAE